MDKVKVIHDFFLNMDVESPSFTGASQTYEEILYSIQQNVGFDVNEKFNNAIP